MLDFDRRELADLAISWAVLTVCFAIAFMGLTPLSIAASGLAVLTGFVFHELAHRFTAERHGCLARYKAWYTGLLLAFVLAVFMKVVFAAPGAVMIYYCAYPLDRRTYGKIALAGPLTNMIIGYASLAALLVLGPMLSSVAYVIIWSMAYVNLFLAAFNLLPIPPLDGSKAIRYNAALWLLLLIASAAPIMLLF